MEYARPLRLQFVAVVRTGGENMRDAEHFKRSYEAGEAPWDIGKPDFNLINIVNTTPIQPCKALEIGCGTGDNAMFLAQQGFEVVAVDSSPIAIDQAQKKAAKAGAKCGFLVLDVFQDHVPGGPYRFVFDRGFLHIIDSDRVRKTVAQTISGYLDPGGMWLSILGNSDEVRRGPGPPQRSASDIVNAVEPSFEILSLMSGHFESRHVEPARAWVCLMRRR